MDRYLIRNSSLTIDFVKMIIILIDEQKNCDKAVKIVLGTDFFFREEALARLKQ